MARRTVSYILANKDGAIRKVSFPLRENNTVGAKEFQVHCQGQQVVPGKYEVYRMDGSLVGHTAVK